MRIISSHLTDEQLFNDLTFDEKIQLAFPRNFNACAGKYGMCTYTEVCAYPQRLRDRILNSEFEENPWDPMSADEDAAGGGEA